MLTEIEDLMNRHEYLNEFDMFHVEEAYLTGHAHGSAYDLEITKTDDRNANISVVETSGIVMDTIEEVETPEKAIEEIEQLCERYCIIPEYFHW